MRRLKFRQWNKSANQFHYWGYVDEDDTFTSPIHGESQQFTGLLDRNLKEIYEGDIIQFRYANQKRLSNGEVKWCVSGWKILSKHQGWFGSRYLDGKCEVIGNIYEQSY